MKKALSLILALLIIILLPVNAMAVGSIGRISDLRTIALNASNYLGYNENWIIVQETPLFNADDEVFAFCFDMVSTDSTPITAYAIVSISKTEFPILLFGYDGTSIYYGKSFEQAYYFGGIDCYIKNDSVYQNERLGATLSSAQVDATFSTALSSTGAEFVDYSLTRQQYLTNNITAAELDTRTVSNAVSLQWRGGCAPTTIAMLIKTKYPSFTGDSLIDELAQNMGTAVGSGSGTPTENITPGINEFFSDRAWLAAPTVCGWNCTTSEGYPRLGLGSNSKESYKTSIMAGFPVGVYCSSSNVSTPIYSGGIPGAHMMAGIGYSYGTAGDFVICYTTQIADGAVSFPITNSGLADHAWFWLAW